MSKIYKIYKNPHREQKERTTGLVAHHHRPTCGLCPILLDILQKGRLGIAQEQAQRRRCRRCQRGFCRSVGLSQPQSNGKAAQRVLWHGWEGSNAYRHQQDGCPFVFGPQDPSEG